MLGNIFIVFNFLWCAVWFVLALMAWKLFLVGFMMIFTIISFLQMLVQFDLMEIEELYFVLRWIK